MKKRTFRPESLMMSYGYHPEWSEGAVKCPIYQTSTFAFRSAEEGKAYFELAYGLREPESGELPGLIYSRVNNPNLEILEERLTLWDDAEAGAVFASGMSAISTVLFELLDPGDLLLYSSPLYGGTAHFITEVLTRYGIEIMPFYPGEEKAKILRALERQGKNARPAMIYLETPANPTNAQIDIAAMRELADDLSAKELPVRLIVDNTFLGPLWQHPLSLGADLVLYSATKYIGGHSDLTAGAVLGSRELINRIKNLRTFFGSMPSPWTSWLLMRSLETLKLRMEQQVRNAQQIAEFLRELPLVERVHYLGLLDESDGREFEIYQRQCSAPGAMIAFEVQGGEAGAFAFLNHLRLIKMAVSLGSTESLAQHPYTMTHAGIPPEKKERMGITPGLVRLSVGVEHAPDLIRDIGEALEAVKNAVSSRQSAIDSRQ